MLSVLVLLGAGIDTTRFSAHSKQSVSSSAASQAGVPLMAMLWFNFVLGLNFFKTGSFLFFKPF